MRYKIGYYNEDYWKANWTVRPKCPMFVSKKDENKKDIDKKK